MISGAFGIGVLSLPAAVQKSGLIIGIVFLLLGAVLAYWTLSCLANAGFKAGAVNYSDLIYKRFGKRSGDAFQYLMITYIVGVLTNFEITGNVVRME